MTGPARGYRWEDAKPGNQLALKHGAYSARVVEPMAVALLDDLERDAPVWLQETDRAALEAWATAEARCRAIRAWLAERPALDAKGRPWPAEDALLRWERRAAEERSRLGFDPVSRARMGRDAAGAKNDLAQAWAAEYVAERRTVEGGGPDAAA